MTAANYPDPILGYVLEHEGGWSDHPRDPGGATMKGVTLATFRRFYGDERTKADLRAITDDQLETIYRSGYWLPVRGPELPSGVDLAVMDAAVNSGPTRAVRWLQKAVAVEADGVIGPATMRAVEAYAPEAVINGVCDSRLAFMRSLGIWSTFGRGWKRRVESVRKRSLSLAAAEPSRWARFLAWDRLPGLRWWG